MTDDYQPTQEQIDAMETMYEECGKATNALREVIDWDDQAMAFSSREKHELQTLIERIEDIQYETLREP